MANDRLFKELCRPEVMQVGWYLAQGDSRDDFVSDPVGHADFAAGLTERLSFLIEQVEQGRYRPRHLIEIDVPKSGLSVRPGNVLPIEEASILHGIVYKLAPFLDNKLSDSVYSYRLHPKWKMKAKKGESMFRESEPPLPFLKKSTLRSMNVFEAWYERWPAFDEDSRAAVTEEGYRFLTKTDISAYFENIDLRLLHDQIRSMLKREEEKIFQLLFRILEGWTRGTAAGMPLGRGIPQGNDVSSFLGNIYLVPLDRELTAFCKKHDAKWFRYVDDVKVFTRNERDARSVVFTINRALRALHLNLQGSKTEILSGQSLAYELDNSKFKRIDAAIDVIRAGTNKTKDHKKSANDALLSISDLCSTFTRGLPESVRNLRGLDNRLFRRLLTAYGTAGKRRTGLPEAALAAIKELPDLRVLRSSLIYLARLDYSTHNTWTERLLDLLEKDDLPFPYQAGTVLESFVNLHPSEPNKIGSRLRHYAFGPGLNRNRDWYVQMKALEALSTFPYRDRYILTIVSRYLTHGHHMVRRAAVSLLPRCPKADVRDRLQMLAEHPDSQVSRLALYLRRLSSDREYSKRELARLRQGNLNDIAMCKRLTLLYAASATEDGAIAKDVASTVTSLPITTSVKLAWQFQQISERVAWSDAQSRDSALAT